MLNSLPLRSKSPALVPATSVGTPQAGQIPSIRLITATPSATGLSSEASTSFNRSLEESWATMPSIPSALAPKSDAEARRRLVPKKSKLSILGMGGGGRDKKEDRAKDLSDVVRRLGVSEGDYSSGRGGFEIYVDPTVDPDIGDIVMIKKKKSRVALNGMAWGPTMGEVTNVPKAKEVKENPGLLKVKSDDEKKWWSIGRGRKDSKEKKEKENKISHKPVEYIHNPPRSKTPEPFKTSQDTRARFNSFDSGVILNGGITKSLSPGALPVETPSNSVRGVSTFQPGPSRIIPMPADDDEDDRPDPATHSRSATPTFGGLLAPPGANTENPATGSIALRAIRSVRSLARMGSWAQLKNMPAPTADEEMANGTVREKKDKTTKEKGTKKKTKEKVASEESKDGKKKGTKKKSTKKEKEVEKPQPARQSSSSFEIGALTASPGTPRDPLRLSTSSSNSKTLGAKKASTLLGIGLPSTMRLPSVRSGSTASSNYGVPVNNAVPAPATINNNRLSVESAHAQANARYDRPASSLSSGSSLRPMSTTSTNSRLSSGSSTASVRWDEQGLETVREQRKKEREIKSRSREMEVGDEEKKERRTSRESKHSIEGRRRTALSSVFPEVRQVFDEVEIGNEMVKEMDVDMSMDVEMDVEEEEDGRDHAAEEEQALRRWSFPIVTIEEATSDGHGRPDSYDEFIAHYEDSEEGSHKGLEEEDQSKPDATPVKKARARPLSEQMLGRSRPKPMYEDEEGVLSILDAATNDLAMLIKNLDLQATPSTPDMTPLRPSMSASPSPTPVSTLEKPGATGSPKRKKNVTESPLSAKSTKKKNDLFRQISTSSINSLRPYAQSRGYPPKPTDSASNNNATNAALISKQIAPWSTLMKGLSPVKEKSAPSAGVVSKKLAKAASPPATIAFRPGHKRTMTPAPEPEPEPVLQPLRPARSRLAVKGKLLKVDKEAEKDQDHREIDEEDLLPRAPASLTFGRSSSRGTVRLSRASEEYSGSLTPVFQRIQDYERKSSLSPSEALSASRSSRGSRSSKGSRSSYGSQNQATSDADDRQIPISRETRRVLGMSGTMGGSDVSCYSEPLDVSDPDSDVPDELRHILATATNSPRASVVGHHDFQDHEVEIDTDMETELEIARSHTPVLPPTLPLNIPKFKAELVDDRDNHFDIEDYYPASPTSEEDTKKSFDFTGELKKLNESGGSDRRSFVEQLENAFRTPAKVDLRYGFDVESLKVEVPPVPELPLSLRMAIEAENSESSNTDGSSGFDEFDSHSQLVNMKFPSVIAKNDTVDAQDSKSNLESKSQFDMFTASRIVDVKEPTMFQGADSLDSNDSENILAKRQLTSSTSSRTSGTSEGELNTSFRFGGRPRSESSAPLPLTAKPLTLSDIIPPPSHARSISGIDALLDGLEDESVMRSIYGHMLVDAAQPRPRVTSESSTDQSALEKRRSVYKAASRPTSGISFSGFDSFDEVRRNFEFHQERPNFYPPAAEANKSTASRRVQHQRFESNFSIASVSSYGRVTKPGSSDPFDFAVPALPSLQERPSSENLTHTTFVSDCLSSEVDDTFAYRADQPRRRVESDASSFYFRPLPQKGARGHRRRESNMSVSSQAPPISLYNRSFGHHRRNDSTASTSSVAMSYVKHGANGGISAWARHRKDQSVDSVMSEFSVLQIARPGIGDKMFDHQGDHGPLTSITASPPESACASQEHFDRRASFDSIMDEELRSSIEIEDSIFERTDLRSTESESVFGEDFARQYRGGLLPPLKYRPISLVGGPRPDSVHQAIRDDDTMISMLGGGHARRCSVGSIVEVSSPCVRVEKRKHSAVQPAHMTKGHDQYESPNKARIVEKPSIASTSSFQFGGERMIRAQHGLLERQSLEEHCLTAEGEDLSVSYHAIPVFTRPGPAGRSRSSTCTSSSGGDTPPLSASDGSSISEGSQSSIDLSQINIALSNATHPISSLARNRVRARARGTGHRRRYSKSHISRSSVYETIEEEINSNQSSPAQSLSSRKEDSPTTTQAVFIVDSDTVSLSSRPEETVWDDERGIVALRKYYALRDEAQTTVTESRKLWLDTPFSLYAIQSFQAPGSPSAMQALLEHSVQNYGPLPSELRPHRRTRTSSRPSPYPQARVSKATFSPEKKRSTNMDGQRTPVVLQTLPINMNTVKIKGKKGSDAPSLSELKPFSPLTMDVVEPKRENAFGLAPGARPRVGSSARRTALGWSKRSNGPKSSTDQKENAVNTSIVITTPGDNLRLNRPRPRGRPTPGGRTPAGSANRPPVPNSTNRPIRI